MSEEDVLSVALHPNGHMLLAGFGNKLRMMAVLSDSLRRVGTELLPHLLSLRPGLSLTSHRSKLTKLKASPLGAAGW